MVTLLGCPDEGSLLDRSNPILFSADIHCFLKNSIGEYGPAEKLAGDASTREYFRIHHEDTSSVLCVDSNFIGRSAGEYPFFIVDGMFQKEGIPVPEIRAFDEKNGLILQEDGGDEHLQKFFPSLRRDEGISLYKRLIDIMVDIQFIEGEGDCIPFCLSFDGEKLMFEFNFFIDNTLLNYFRARMSQTEIRTLRSEFTKVAEMLYRPELFVLNHRDFHSRNVLIRPSGPFVIDFQDARMGLPQYDAASLLRDSYLVLEDDVVEILKGYHFHRLNENGYGRMTFEEYAAFFDLMAFQRNVKALGTFGYQITSRGNTVYEPYISPTVAYLSDYIVRREELKAAGEILLKYIV
ncbi:MAG: phosphotransferase [bacterium]